MSRTLAREDAFKLLFEMRITGSQPDDVIEYLIQTLGEDNDMWAQKRISKTNLEYIRTVTTGTEENLAKINSIIESKLKNWSIDRLSKVNLVILQLAVYEIEFIDDIPFKVSVNEAVELAKKYGDTESGAFINGVLGSIIKTKTQQ